MSISESCAAVIPCLNEAATIRQLVIGALKYLPEVIVVDDGSTDGTSSVARVAGATVLRHSASRGKGASLTNGFNKARKMGYSWALAMDGDGQHCARDIPVLISYAERSCARMVVGDRMGEAAQMPAIRLWVNRWMSQTLSDYCGGHWPDSQCGFRLLDLDCWSQFEWRAEHFEIESELLVRFALAGHAIQFVSIPCRYAAERSKIRPLRDTWRWFRWWAALKAELGPLPEAQIDLGSPGVPVSTAAAE